MLENLDPIFKTLFFSLFTPFHCSKLVSSLELTSAKYFFSNSISFCLFNKFIYLIFFQISYLTTQEHTLQLQTINMVLFNI